MICTSWQLSQAHASQGASLDSKRAAASKSPPKIHRNSQTSQRSPQITIKVATPQNVNSSSSEASQNASAFALPIERSNFPQAQPSGAYFFSQTSRLCQKYSIRKPESKDWNFLYHGLNAWSSPQPWKLSCTVAQRTVLVDKLERIKSTNSLCLRMQKAIAKCNYGCKRRWESFMIHLVKSLRNRYKLK